LWREEAAFFSGNGRGIAVGRVLLQHFGKPTIEKKRGPIKKRSALVRQNVWGTRATKRKELFAIWAD